MLLAAATATSLLLPITKLSRVYLELRPLLGLLLFSMVFLMVLVRDLSESEEVTSRGRTLGLVVAWTSKSIVLTSTPFLVRESVIRFRNLERSCLT